MLQAKCHGVGDCGRYSAPKSAGSYVEPRPSQDLSQTLDQRLSQSHRSASAKVGEDASPALTSS
jgi:hypothetical protein